MLAPGNGRPLFMQLKEIIVSKVRSGEYPLGSKLPSERELAETFGISRMTVRQTMNHLVSQQIVEKKPGKGNFVVDKLLENRLDSLLGFVEEFQLRQLDFKVKLHSSNFITANQQLSKDLQVPEGARVLEIIRTILFKDVIIGVDYTWVNESIGLLVNHLDLENLILYQFLEDAGYNIFKADQIITAKMPTEKEKKWLNIGDEALLVINRVATNESNGPLVASHTFYLTEYYHYNLTLLRYPVTRRST